MSEDNSLKRSVKDTVFSDLFKIKKYTAQLYEALHPGAEIREEDIGEVHTQNIISNGIHNDLSVYIKDSVLLLAEAQSTWTFNILFRMLEYLVGEYHDYVMNTEQNTYGSKKINLPKAELYVIYSGDKEITDDVLSLAKEFFGGDDSVIDLKVKLIRASGSRDIIDQYIAFCHEVNDVTAQMGRTREAMQEIYRRCMEENVLKEYLYTRRSEVFNMMFTLFDQEYADRMNIRDAERRGRAEGRAEGEARGIAKGEARGKDAERISTIRRMINKNMTKDFILDMEYSENEYNRALQSLSA